jgi:hypothetical protein
MLRVAVVTVYEVDMTKFVPVVPCETSTKLFPLAGTAIVTPAGMAPPAVDVNVVPVPLGHATAVDWKQYAYTVLGEYPEPDKVIKVPAGPLLGVRASVAVVTVNAADDIGVDPW